jgi:hypothetical protein
MASASRSARMIVLYGFITFFIFAAVNSTLSIPIQMKCLAAFNFQRRRFLSVSDFQVVSSQFLPGIN